MKRIFIVLGVMLMIGIGSCTIDRGTYRDNYRPMDYGIGMYYNSRPGIIYHRYKPISHNREFIRPTPNRGSNEFRHREPLPSLDMYIDIDSVILEDLNKMVIY